MDHRLDWGRVEQKKPVLQLVKTKKTRKKKTGVGGKREKKKACGQKKKKETGNRKQGRGGITRSIRQNKPGKNGSPRNTPKKKKRNTARSWKKGVTKSTNKLKLSRGKGTTLRGRCKNKKGVMRREG